ncbi:CaiB/BaiF CoA transferase family protein [Chloroflexota bacterium]
MEKAFEGIKVVEFTWIVLGPSMSRYLTDHGATVVKVESHNRYDPSRGQTPFAQGKSGMNRSMHYGKYNADKYSVSLDMKHPNGLKLIWKLIAWADILTESFTPGTMTKFGLDYESVQKVNPDIIYLSTCLQGQTGPYAQYRGFGPQVISLAGFGEITGWPGQMPLLPFGPYSDFLCPNVNATAIIAALDYRRRTGKGQHIDQSQFETSLHYISPLILDYIVNGRLASRNGNRLPYAAPHGVYPCKGDDRWIAIGVFTDTEWESFCKSIGEPEWRKKPGFSTLPGRKENEDELDRLVAEWTINFTAEEIESNLQAAGVPVNVVEKISDLFQDPQLKHRNYFTYLNHPEMGNCAYEPQARWILSETPREVSMPSPCLGEHNEYVFKELLGLTDDEIAEHIIDGSITTEVKE